MENNFSGSLKVVFDENNDPGKMPIYIYNGLLDSQLFNAQEVMLLIHLIVSAKNTGLNQINTTTLSIKKLCQKTKISNATVCKYIKTLEKKGVLVKTNRMSEESGYLSNEYDILNFVSVWDCQTLDELKKETDRIKSEV